MHEIQRRRIKNLKTGVVMDGYWETPTGHFTPDGASTSFQVLYTEWEVSRILLELPTEDGIYGVANYRDRPEIGYTYRLVRDRWVDASGASVLNATQMEVLRMHHREYGLVRLSATGPTLGGPQD